MADDTIFRSGDDVLWLLLLYNLRSVPLGFFFWSRLDVLWGWLMLINFGYRNRNQKKGRTVKKAQRMRTFVCGEIEEKYWYKRRIICFMIYACRATWSAIWLLNWKIKWLMWVRYFEIYINLSTNRKNINHSIFQFYIRMLGFRGPC